MSDTSPIEDSARARILDAAVQEIAQHGFAAARVDAIARAAGVNKQLIYYYFESKSGLREAVLVEMVRSYKPFWERVDQSTLPAILDGVPSAGSSAQWLTWRRLLAWEGVEYLENAHREIVLEESRREAYARQTERLRREQQSGDIPEDVDAEALSLLLIFARVGPLVLPQVTRMVMGEDASEQETRTAISKTLKALFEQWSLGDPKSQ
jgi:TetR/AcrR family transcriptional regulator